MIRIHPIVVHFPIALFVSALGMEVLSLVLKKENLHRSARVNYVLGVIASFFAILSAWVENEQIKHPVFYTHRLFGYLTFGVSFVGLFISKRSRIVFFIFLITLAFLVAITGFYGGRLVYEYGVGVQ